MKYFDSNTQNINDYADCKTSVEYFQYEKKKISETNMRKNS